MGIRSVLHIQGGHKIMTNVQGKTTRYFNLLPNHHNLDFSSKAQKYNVIICFIYNSPSKGHHKTQSDVGYLTPRIWKQFFCSWGSASFSSSFQPCIQPISSLFLSCCVFCITPCFHSPENPTINPPSLKFLFRCFLVKHTQWEPRENAISRGPYEKWKESECYRNEAWSGSQQAFHVVRLHRQQARKGRNNLFFQASLNTHYIICFSQVKTTVIFSTLSGIHFLPVKYLESMN